MRRPPKRLFRSRRRQPVRMVGTVFIGGEPVAVVDPAGLDHLDQVDLDRTIGERTGLREWLRPIRPDGHPDPARVIDPTPETLAEAEALREVWAEHTHILVAVFAPGLRARLPLNVSSQAELN